MTSLTFHREQAWGALLLRWWEDLDRDTGGRAALRRAPNVTAVVLQPAFQRLHRQLVVAGWPHNPGQSDRKADLLAAAAGLLAHVRQASDETLPVAMSQREGDKPRVSELRFRRLLDAADADSLFPALRRALPLVKHRCDPLALATDVVNWGDAVRKRWAYTYDWPARSAGS